MEPLTPRDTDLLRLLQRDSRISNADMAHAVGMSPSACWRRVRALEEAGVIEGYTIRINPAAAGLQFHAIVHVQLVRHDPDAVAAFIEAMRGRDEVRECFATTGQADYHLRVLCRDVEAYNRFLEERLFPLTAVQSANTHMILRDLKSETPVSL
ncbi:winged helix-turn-helix transcriptional regulator [Aquicoccus sp. SCR17]|nr:winged helix-turn-helix transcriptional regulator [Carideicomes alvinocaridis]